MPERGFDTTTWDGDDWFQELSRDQRYLFIYLWTNNHCNPAGLYHITVPTMAFETKFTEEELRKLLPSLEPKVKWFPGENLVWVKNFVKRQSKSPKFLIAVAKSLIAISNNGPVHELLEYNEGRHSISIPYQYYMDRVSILTRASASNADTKASSNAGAEEKGDAKGEKPGLAQEKVELLTMIRGLKHWRTTDDDVEWLQRFEQEFPEFGRSDLTACADYHSGRIEANHKGDWKNRLRNWMLSKRQFTAERKAKAGAINPTDPDKFIKGKYGHMVKR